MLRFLSECYFDFKFILIILCSKSNYLNENFRSRFTKIDLTSKNFNFNFIRIGLILTKVV